MNAKQVWQRVQESAGMLQERQAMLALMEQLEKDIVFLQTYPGGGRLAEEMKEQAAVLRGIRSLSTGQQRFPLPQGNKTVSLGQCYGHSLQRHREYLLRSADPQFGPIYHALAEQARQDCLRLAALAGSINCRK